MSDRIDCDVCGRRVSEFDFNFRCCCCGDCHRKYVLSEPEAMTAAGKALPPHAIYELERDRGRLGFLDGR